MGSQFLLHQPIANEKHAPALGMAAESVTSILAGRFGDYYQLTKPRIALLIVISTAVGYCYGITAGFRFTLFLHTLFGTALMAAGAAALNQWYERDIDACMKRTQMRPIASGRLSPAHAWLFGIVISVLGTFELWFYVNRIAAVLGIVTSLSYLLAYTPLKRVHPICTTIGAIPGAIPPVIGFVAASGGHLAAPAFVLFSMLFLWQFPHFHAIAWLLKQEYETAGIKMLAALRPNGIGLTLEILLSLLLLIPITLAPSFIQMAGNVYFWAALVLDLAFFYFGVRMSITRTRPNARLLLLASVIYLPLLFAFLVFDSPRFTL